MREIKFLIFQYLTRVYGRFLLLWCVLIFLCAISTASAQSNTSKLHSDTAHPNYDYTLVCKFIDSQLTTAENLIKSGDHKKITLLFVDPNSSIRKYRYNNNGISVEYIETSLKKIVISANFAANTFPANMRSKSLLLSKFGIMNTGELTDEISLGCDAMTVQINFRGDDLKHLTIYTNFVD